MARTVKNTADNHLNDQYMYVCTRTDIAQIGCTAPLPLGPGKRGIFTWNRFSPCSSAHRMSSTRLTDVLALYASNHTDGIGANEKLDTISSVMEGRQNADNSDWISQ